MNGEQKIIIAGVVILVIGIGKAALDKKPLDVPIVGGVTFVLLLSLVSALGPALSNLAGDFALLGMATVVLVDAPEVINAVQKQQTTGAGEPASSGVTSGTPR